MQSSSIRHATDVVSAAEEVACDVAASAIASTAGDVGRLSLGTAVSAHDWPLQGDLAHPTKARRCAEKSPIAGQEATLLRRKANTGA